MRRIADGRLAAMFLVLALLAIYFHVATHGIFFGPRNLSLLLRQGSIAAVVASGVSILIVMGEIDLSIGSAVYLCSVIAASLQANVGVAHGADGDRHRPCGRADGGVAGHSGSCKVAVPSFVVTLSGLLAFRGIGYYMSDARTIAPVSKSFSFSQRGFHPADRVLHRFVRPLCDRGGGADLGAPAACRGERRGKARRPARDFRGRRVCLLAWIFGGYLGIPSALLWVAGTGIVLTILMDAHEIRSQHLPDRVEPRGCGAGGHSARAAAVSRLSVDGRALRRCGRPDHFAGWARRRQAPAYTWSWTPSPARSSVAPRCAAASAAWPARWSARCCSTTIDNGMSILNVRRSSSS